VAVYLYPYENVPDQSGRTVLDAHLGHRIRAGSAGRAAGFYELVTLVSRDGESMVTRGEDGAEQTRSSAVLWAYGTPLCLDCHESDTLAAAP